MQLPLAQHVSADLTSPLTKDVDLSLENCNNSTLLEFPTVQSSYLKNSKSNEARKDGAHFVPIRPALIQFPVLWLGQKPEPSRKWRLVKQDLTQLNGKTLFINVTCKTRCEEVCLPYTTFFFSNNYVIMQPSDVVPDNIYSSLKYEIRSTVNGTLVQEVPFLLAKISVIAATGEEIKKSVDKSSVLKGTVEASMNKLPDNTLEGILKVQFAEVSFHHDNKSFLFEIKYFMPNHLNEPVHVARSAPFKVLARKPSQGKKRKVNHLEQFSSKLDELVHAAKKIKTEKQKNAVFSLVTKKLYELDPDYFPEIVAQAVSRAAEQNQLDQPRD
jgi:hypothetical protein